MYMNPEQPGMAMPMQDNPHMMMPHKEFINMLQDCTTTCYHTASFLLNRPDLTMRANQIKMLLDCARICESQVFYTVNNSTFARQHAAMCAMVCIECSRECAKHNDAMSQHCSRVCYECALACQRFSQGM